MNTNAVQSMISSAAKVCAAAALWLCLAAMPAMAQGISDLKNHDVDQPFDIAADRVEVRDKANTAIFSGNVNVNQGNLKLAADSLRVFYERQGGDTPAILRLDARGNVRMTSPTEKINSAWSIYDVRSEIVTMGGQVRFTSDDARLVGDRLELNLRTGLTTLDSDVPTAGSGQQRVEGRFAVPKKSNNR